MSLTTVGVFRSNLLNPVVGSDANPSLILRLVSTLDVLNPMARLKPEFLYSVFLFIDYSCSDVAPPSAAAPHLPPADWASMKSKDSCSPSCTLSRPCQTVSVMTRAGNILPRFPTPVCRGLGPRRGLLVQDLVWTKLGRCSSVRGSCQDTFRAPPWYSWARFQMLTQGLGWAGDLFRVYPAFNHTHQGEASAPSSIYPKEKRRILVLMKAHIDAQIDFPFKPTSKTAASMLKENKWGSNRELFIF